MKSDRSYRSIYIQIGSGLVAGLTIGWFLFHSDKKVEYREQVKVEYVDRVEYKDRIVEKVVKDASSSRQQNVRVITKYIERPDGTKEMTKEEVTDTKEAESSKTVADKTQEKEIKREVVIQKEVQIEKVETPVNKNWHLSASAGLTTDLLPVYGAQIERRFIGQVFLGLKADSNPSAFIVAGFDF